MSAISRDISGHTDLSEWPLDKLEILHVEMGMQCNVRCAMCFQTEFGTKENLPEIVWRERLRPAYQAARELIIVGGEPTIMANCRELLTLVRRDFPHLRLTTATNGIQFDGVWEEAFLEQGATLNFSLNAVTPALYRKLVQFGNQARAIANIDRLVSCKQTTGSPVILRISMVIRDDTISEMPLFVQWAADHGLDQVMLAADLVGTVKHVKSSVVQQKIAEAYAVVERNPQLKLIHLHEFDQLYAQQQQIPPVRSWQPPAPGLAPCVSAFNMLLVSSDGTAKPCCVSWYIYGNLCVSTLDEIWNGSKATRFRDRINRLDFRDCWAACPDNMRPVHPRLSLFRRGLWSLRRNPRSAYKKVLRKLNIASSKAISRT